MADVVTVQGKTALSKTSIPVSVKAEDGSGMELIAVRDAQNSSLIVVSATAAVAWRSIHSDVPGNLPMIAAIRSPAVGIAYHVVTGV